MSSSCGEVGGGLILAYKICLGGGDVKWNFARTHQFHSFSRDESTVAQRAETTVAECVIIMYCMLLIVGKVLSRFVCFFKMKIVKRFEPFFWEISLEKSVSSFLLL